MISYDILQALQNAKSSSGGTSLITWFVKPNTNLWLVNEKITTELSTASNIKSSSVRNDVVASLKSISQNLKNIKNIGANGLIILSGTYSIDTNCYI